MFVLTKKPRHNQTRFVASTIKNSNYRNNDDDENDNNNDNDNKPLAIIIIIIIIIKHTSSLRLSTYSGLIFTQPLPVANGKHRRTG